MQQTFRPLLSKSSKIRPLGILIPILRKLGAAYNFGGWLVGKPVYDFLFAIIELFSLALTVEALQGKTCQDSLLSGGGKSD